MSETIEYDTLRPRCDQCLNECVYLKQDSVSFSGVRFIERVLTCTGCGRAADAPAYFPAQPKDECSL